MFFYPQDLNLKFCLRLLNPLSLELTINWWCVDVMKEEMCCAKNGRVRGREESLNRKNYLSNLTLKKRQNWGKKL